MRVCFLKKMAQKGTSLSLSPIHIDDNVKPEPVDSNRVIPSALIFDIYVCCPGIAEMSSADINNGIMYSYMWTAIPASDFCHYIL